jgi:hypothetical protein
MSLNQREINQLIGFARAVIVDVDNAVAVSGGAGDGTLLFVDLDEVNAAGYTRNALATLINRAYGEQPGVGSPPDLAES